MKCILNLIDSSFDQGHAEKYRLSILLRPDGFSFCVLDSRTFTFLALSDFHITPLTSSGLPRSEKLCEGYKERFQSVDLLRLPFGSIDLVYASPKTTLVPPGFLRDETVDSYFRFNHPLDAFEIVVSQPIPVGEMTAVFALPACIMNLSKEWFRDVKPGCSATVLIQGLLKANSHILTRQVFVNVWGSYFDIIVLHGRKLLYYNTFRKQASEDLIYFVVYVLEQMGFIPAEEDVTLMGEILVDSDDYRLLYLYIDRLHFASLSSVAEFSPVFSEVLVHKYFTLFNLPFCE